MISFRGTFLRELPWPTGTVWLMTDIAEAKGRGRALRPALKSLKSLRETALIQSVESSNRIEGVTVAPDRLRPLVTGRARPRDRSEAELRGYRRALQLIHSRATKLNATPELLRRLHRTIQEGSSDAGKWKQTENEIIEFRANAPPVVRFRPLSFKETPAAVDELCLAYRAVTNQGEVAPLVAVAALVFDFLCIHPFRDGNGRVSRLLTHLELARHGYRVGQIVSLERIIEESQDEYYPALRKSSLHWHEGKHDLIPWLNYFLGFLRKAYREHENLSPGPAATPKTGKKK